jgi:hypothetical protein
VANLAKIQDVIWEMHRCASTHVESVTLDERVNGKQIWAGTVEVFDLTNHSKAKRCFAWSYKDEKGEDCYCAVLDIPPVTNPRIAVMATLLARAKK